MTLAECKEQIEQHRFKASQLRRKADAEDRKADELRAEAAKLATPPLFGGGDAYAEDCKG